MTGFSFRESDCIFDTHTKIQNTFIEKIHTDGTEAALEWLSGIKGNTELSYPNVLELCFENDGSGVYTVELSEVEDFRNPLRYVTDKALLAVENLKIGQTYYWRVNGGKVKCFETLKNAPRFIRIDGALNVRDIGGGKIKQGLIYRGSDIETHYPITDIGRRTFTEELKIKTEIELRSEVNNLSTSSVAGCNVRRVTLPYRPYLEVFRNEYLAGIRKIMEFLSDESVYPVYIHCRGGADRTGMIALYLRALAGDSDDEIHTDYELTALSTYALGGAEGADGFRSRNAEYYVNFLNKLNEYGEEKPLSVTVRRFLISAGVSPKTLDKIVSIIKA